MFLAKTREKAQLEAKQSIDHLKQSLGDLNCTNLSNESFRQSQEIPQLTSLQFSFP